MLPRFQETAYKALLDYLQTPKTPSACLCLVGPPGTGKTYLVDLAAKALGYKVVQHDDEEDIKETSASSSLFGKRLLVIDEPDEALPLSVLAKKRAIVVSTNAYEGPMKTMRTKLRLVRMHEYTSDELATLLMSHTASAAAAKMLGTQCAPDMRYALTMLDFATRTAKAKRPGGQSILCAHDCEFDLFRDVKNAFAGTPNTGVGSSDFFLYSTMLQTNCLLRTKKLLKVLDAFAHLDVLEDSHELPVDSLIDFAHAISNLCQVPSNLPLSMPRIANPGKKEKLLREAAKTRENSLVCYERLLAIDAPDRLTKKNEWYHEDADVRALLKRPFVKST